MSESRKLRLPVHVKLSLAELSEDRKKWDKPNRTDSLGQGKYASDMAEKILDRG
jgi:hypothetical protein